MGAGPARLQPRSAAEARPRAPGCLGRSNTSSPLAAGAVQGKAGLALGAAGGVVAVANQAVGSGGLQAGWGGAGQRGGRRIGRLAVRVGSWTTEERSTGLPKARGGPLQARQGGAQFWAHAWKPAAARDRLPLSPPRRRQWRHGRIPGRTCGKFRSCCSHPRRSWWRCTCGMGGEGGDGHGGACARPLCAAHTRCCRAPPWKS